MYCAERQYNLTYCTDTMNISVVGNFHARRLLALEGHASDQGVCEHGEIGLIHPGIGIRTKCRQTLAIADSKFENRGAATFFHHAAVVILEGWNPHRASRFNHGRCYRAGIRCGLNKNWPSCSAVLWIWSAVPVFNAAVDFQHRFIAPWPVVRFRREEIPIVLVASRPSHQIDTGSTTQYFSHG